LFYACDHGLWVFPFNREAEGTGVVLRKGLRNIVASCQPCLEPALAVIN